MKEAIGGALVIEIIIVFLLVINSYLAFSVNYTKAFRVKNRIISIIENHEGYDERAKTEIEQMMIDSYYNISDAYLNRCQYLNDRLDDENGRYDKYTNNAGGFCMYKVPVSIADDNIADETYKGAVYGVAVYVNIDLPILNRIFPYLSNVFAIKGETKSIYSKNAYDGLS